MCKHILMKIGKKDDIYCRFILSQHCWIVFFRLFDQRFFFIIHEEMEDILEAVSFRSPCHTV